MVPTLGNEVLDIVVAPEGSMVAMVDLDHRRGATGPGAGAVTGVNGTALMRGDSDGAAPEVKRITVAVLEDGEEPGIAGQPSGGIASDGNAGRFENVGRC
jgi:hypothetical protein